MLPSKTSSKLNDTTIFLLAHKYGLFINIEYLHNLALFFYRMYIIPTTDSMYLYKTTFKILYYMP